MDRRQPRILVEDPRAQRVLLDALKGRSRGHTELVKLTRSDAVALTGLPSEQAEPALKKLAGTYRSHLAVTEQGELVYEFDPSLERRDRVTLAERLRRAAELGWKGFQFLFKIWIVATLVIYVVAFIAMMLSLLVVRSSSDRDDRRGGDGFGFPWIWFLLMPDWGPQPMDRYGRPMRRRVEGKSRKRFYQAVFDYVFGEKQAPADPRRGDKRVLAYLREHQGRLSAADVVALTGLSFEQADEELTRLMVEYDGEVEVTEGGTLIYVFRELRRTAAEVEPQPAALRGGWTYLWDRPASEPALTGNTAGTNTVITGFSAFNLIASQTIGPAFLLRMHLALEPTALFFVTTFPLIFSLLFFAVPAGRYLVARRRRRRTAAERVRAALLRELWSQPRGGVEPGELSSQVAKRIGVPAKTVRAELERLLGDLDGDVVNDDSGAVRYVFPRLTEERAAAERARLAAPAAEAEVGAVIFSSEGD